MSLPRFPRPHPLPSAPLLHSVQKNLFQQFKLPSKPTEVEKIKQSKHTDTQQTRQLVPNRATNTQAPTSLTAPLACQKTQTIRSKDKNHLPLPLHHPPNRFRSAPGPPAERTNSHYTRGFIAEYSVSSRAMCHPFGKFHLPCSILRTKQTWDCQQPKRSLELNSPSRKLGPRICNTAIGPFNAALPPLAKFVIDSASCSRHSPTKQTLFHVRKIAALLLKGESAIHCLLHNKPQE